MSGSVVVFPTLDGPRNPISSGAQTLDFTGSGPNQQRQESPHPHQVLFHPEGNELLVPDLGADRTQRLRRDTNGSWKIEGAVHYVPASGPRHVALYGKLAFASD